MGVIYFAWIQMKNPLPRQLHASTIPWNKGLEIDEEKI